jgi:hypothetical protein
MRLLPRPRCLRVAASNYAIRPYFNQCIAHHWIPEIRGRIRKLCSVLLVSNTSNSSDKLTSKNKRIDENNWYSQYLSVWTPKLSGSFIWLLARWCGPPLKIIMPFDVIWSYRDWYTSKNSGPNGWSPSIRFLWSSSRIEESKVDLGQNVTQSPEGYLF